MSDYDFSSLNDKEFESLVVDLLSEEEGKRFERFKPGRDKGVDGRYFSPSTSLETIVQCKHWIRTPVNQLINRLITDELPKVQRLKPARYIVGISNPLSRANKEAIFEKFRDFIKTPSDILG